MRMSGTGHADRQLKTTKTLRHIVARLLVKAESAWQESEENIDDLFVQGRRDAYFEILDMLPDDVLVEELNARGW